MAGGGRGTLEAAPLKRIGVFGEEGLREEWGLSWSAGKAGQAGKAKEGACPTPVLGVGGCHPQHARARSPPSSPGVCSTSWPPPGAAVALQVTMARRERREDAQHWGIAASSPLGEQPPCQTGPLPQHCPHLPALSPGGTRGPQFGGWPLSGCLPWLLLCPDHQPHSHQAASLPSLCFPWLPGWEKEWGTPGSTRPVPMVSHRGRRSHPEQEWQPPSSGQGIKVGGSRRRLWFKSMGDPHFTPCPTPGLPPGPAFGLWDTHSPKPSRAAAALALA